MSAQSKIESIIVTLEDGRWQRLDADDIKTAREFALAADSLAKDFDLRLWRLLEFIANLSPAIQEQSQPGIGEAASGGAR